jgi:anionic cell wall polymer biosynthesis LytR-Cps2A-Psr (LCP) family protein
MVSYVTGLTVQSYIAVDFNGFKRAIDSIKGVDVDVPNGFDDFFYPIKGLENETCGKTAEEITELSSKYSDFALDKNFTCRYEHLHFEKGITHMDGETALKFVRSRHSDTEGSDFSRSVRQQALLIAIKNKLLSLKAQDNIDTFHTELTKSITTDLTPAVLKEFIRQFGLPTQYTFKNINLNESNVLKSAKSSGGQYILIPKVGEGGWGSVQEYVKKELNK